MGRALFLMRDYLYMYKKLKLLLLSLSFCTTSFFSLFFHCIIAEYIFSMSLLRSEDVATLKLQEEALQGKQHNDPPQQMQKFAEV